MPDKVEKRIKSTKILNENYKSDDLKLVQIFEIYKDDLEKNYTNLYYALLGWRDSHLKELKKEESMWK